MILASKFSNQLGVRMWGLQIDFEFPMSISNSISKFSPIFNLKTLFSYFIFLLLEYTILNTLYSFTITFKYSFFIQKGKNPCKKNLGADSYDTFQVDSGLDIRFCILKSFVLPHWWLSRIRDKPSREKWAVGAQDWLWLVQCDIDCVGGAMHDLLCGWHNADCCGQILWHCKW